MHTLSQPFPLTKEISAWMTQYGYRNLHLIYENVDIVKYRVYSSNMQKPHLVLEAERCAPSGEWYSFQVGHLVKWEPGITNNCGMVAITTPWCLADVLKAQWLDLIEAYARWCGRSILLFSDNVYAGSIFKYIRDYGKNYHFSPGTLNMNYSNREEKAHYHIGMMWKNIGEETYPNYGFKTPEELQSA